MATELKAPVFPESVADGIVVAWHKKEGDPVTQDENLVDIETDKVVLEVPAPVSGTLKKISKKVGETTLAQELLGIIEEGAKPILSPAPKTAKAEKIHTPVLETAVAGPAARRLAEENKLELARIQGTGKGGRVIKEDVIAEIQSESKEAVLKSTTPTSKSVFMDEASQRVETRVPMTRLRAKIAERLVDAQHTAAILTTFNEVNLQAVMGLRNTYKEAFEKKHHVRLGFMSFFVKAAVEALKRSPVINASVDETDIIYHGFYDIGVAVSSPRGLVVPILRNVEQMSLADIEKAIADYAEKAKDGKLTIEEMSGGTFTISNGGVFGSLLSTPILNPPQSAILGMHKIQERPVVEKGQIVIRPMMYLALSYDHRIVDGREAVTFLVTIKDLLEDPARLLLEI